MPLLFLALAVVFPRRHVREARVVPLGFALRGGALLAEVAAAGLAAFECVARHEFAEFEVVGDAAGNSRSLLKSVRAAAHAHVR